VKRRSNVLQVKEPAIQLSKQIPIQDSSAITNCELLRAWPTSVGDDRVQQYNKEQQYKRRRLRYSLSDLPVLGDRSRLFLYSYSPSYSTSKAFTTADQQQQQEEEEGVQEERQIPSTSIQAPVVPTAPIATTLLPEDIYQVPASVPTYLIQLPLVAEGHPKTPVTARPRQLKPSVCGYYWIIIDPEPNYCYKRQ
jgi:hypothetical protein